MGRARLAMLALAGLVIAVLGGLRGRHAARRTGPRGARPVVTPLVGPGSETAAPPAAFEKSPLDPVPGWVSGLDRGLAISGVCGLVVTAGLMIWDAAGLEPSLPTVRGRSWSLVTVLATLIIWAIYLFWKVPQWQAAGRRGASGVGAKELFDIENAARGTLGQMLGGLAVITGLVFAWQQLGNTSDTLQVSEQGQITERFTRAVDQLGSDDLTVRLGGVYALDRISGDSARDYGPVMEVLTAYVRQTVPRRDSAATPAASPGDGADGSPVDVQAILTILGRRTEPWHGAGCLDLSGTDLRGADLTGANLTGMCLSGSDLTGAALARSDLRGTVLSSAVLLGADLGGANLEEASLAGAKLAGANLLDANVTGASLLSADATGALFQNAILGGTDFNGANLSGALFFGADLTGAILTDANLSGAFLSGADLRGARGLTRAQVASATVDEQTQLPDDVRATLES